MILFIWLGSVFGWLAVFGAMIAFFLLGVMVMFSAGTSATNSLRQITASGYSPEDRANIGSSTVTFVAGLFIAIPGFISSAIGLIALLPFVRSFTKAAIVKYGKYRMNRSGFSIVTTTLNGVRRTQVFEGDVVQGDVVSDPNGQSSEGNGSAGSSNQHPHDNRTSAPKQLAPDPNKDLGASDEDGKAI